jgi:hypothetical protein
MQPMQPMQQPMQPMQQQPQKKKGLSGCAIAGIIVGVIVLLGVIAVVGVVVFVINKAKEVVGDMTAAVKEAQNAPGAAELRASGCSQAMVLDLDKFANQALKDMPGNLKVDAGGGTMVQCEIAAGTEMNCMKVAHTFVSTPGHATGPFTASVTDASGNQKCARDFDAEGKDLGAATRHVNTNTSGH